MAFNPNASQLSQEQIIQQVFDPVNNALQTEINAPITIDGEVAVEFSAASGDNVAIANQTGTNFLVINSNGSINASITDFPAEVEVTQGTSPWTVSGSVTVSNFPTSQTISGTVNTNLNGLVSFQTSQTTVGTSAVQLDSSPLSGRTSLSVKVITSGGAIIFIGNSTSVTTSNGYPLFNGDSIQLDLTTAEHIWAISANTGQTACLLEIG
jgi:hypothetical protein